MDGDAVFRPDFYSPDYNMIHGDPPFPISFAGRSTLIMAEAWSVMRDIRDDCIDIIATDPPYFLSGEDGTTCSGGKRVRVSKGSWDAPKSAQYIMTFYMSWLKEAWRILRPGGTIWICGSMHSIWQAGFALQTSGFEILNSITWEKPNPPPNLGCRCFTHSHETIIWAKVLKRPKSAKYYFDYDLMKSENGDKQMKDVWRIAPPSNDEKVHGKHPAQKPVELMSRMIKASCPPDGIVLDPFCGSGTAGVATQLTGRPSKFIGIDSDPAWIAVASKRIADANR